MRSPRKASRWIFRVAVYGTLGLFAALGLRGCYAFRDRIPGYSLNIDRPPPRPEALRPFRAGFGRIKITPDTSDPHHPVWIAGFSQHRAATGVHDDLWAVACVLDDGSSRVGIVVMDAIGFFQDDVVRVRRRLEPDWKIDYAIVCSTHDHSAPDLMGLWGPDLLHTGVDLGYRTKVTAACVEALGLAVSNLQPACVAFHEIPTETAGLVADTRKPEVFDPNIRVIHVTKPATGETLGSIVGWADHPETVWGQNTQITADFCGYLREALEHGVTREGRQVAQGVGGIHLYVNGAIGGLMTTPPGVTVHDPYLDVDCKEPSHAKARALGHQLASRILPVLAAPGAGFTNCLPISIRARGIEVHLHNTDFLLAGYLGLLDRGYLRWRTLRTEVALLGLGEATIACVPGEIYPEIVNGGIERAPGGDFDVDPIEIPPLRALMPGRVKFVFGLANDELGYIIPKSEWDEKPPYLYGAPHRPYGEINSVGPDTAAAIHSALKALCAP